MDYEITSFNHANGTFSVLYADGVYLNLIAPRKDGVYSTGQDLKTYINYIHPSVRIENDFNEMEALMMDDKPDTDLPNEIVTKAKEYRKDQFILSFANMAQGSNFNYFKDPGTYKFTVPQGMTTATAVLISGGSADISQGPGRQEYQHINLTEGEVITITVGAPGGGTAPGGSSFIQDSTGYTMLRSVSGWANPEHKTSYIEPPVGGLGQPGLVMIWG